MTRARTWVVVADNARIRIFLNLADSQFDQLVLIAPPPMLKDLRRHLGPKAAKFVAAELGKDLTQLPQSELTLRLHEALAV